MAYGSQNTVQSRRSNGVTAGMQMLQPQKKNQNVDMTLLIDGEMSTSPPPAQHNGNHVRLQHKDAGHK